MKPPINSPSKDFAINFMKKKEQGYFSSNRPGGKGQTDIYSFKMPPIIYTLQGTIKDVDCKKPIAGATVKLIGTDGSSVEALTDDQGFYKFDEKENGDRFLIDNTSYTIVVNKTSKAKNISTDCNSTDFTKRGYLNGKGQETTVGVERSTAFVHDFEIQCSNCGEIKFRTVLYELAKWDLMVTDQVNSKDSLNDLYQTLIDNPNIVIELAAHTDSRDSDQRNLVLSQKRAQSCVDYLVEKGIDPARLVPKGYGESNLLITDAEIAKLKSKEEKEAAHQKNRRTVFSVLRDDFVPTEAPQGDAPQ
ncbi:MAG: OmpA family protein, partial [Flavobacteriales bacterium]|nr:OmpA family protein [Flavobacteriales bacterium]